MKEKSKAKRWAKRVAPNIYKTSEGTYRIRLRGNGLLLDCTEPSLRAARGIRNYYKNLYNIS
jgi:hypothetical protein